MRTFARRWQAVRPSGHPTEPRGHRGHRTAGKAGNDPMPPMGPLLRISAHVATRLPGWRPAGRADGKGNFASAPSAPFSSLFFTGLVRTVGTLFFTATTVRLAGNHPQGIGAKPLTRLDRSGGADDANGADGCVLPFSGTANAGVRERPPEPPDLAADGKSVLALFSPSLSPVPWAS
jgi:hypothetical protein